LQFSRRLIGAFARSVDSTAAEYFDPIMASYDGYRDVIAPAVFVVVPGQEQQNTLLTENTVGMMPLLHGIHLEIFQPVVAGMRLNVATEVTQKRMSSPVSALTTVSTVNDANNNTLAIVTQKLALLSTRSPAPTPADQRAENSKSPDSSAFQFPMSKRDLTDYLTVSGDTNPIHNSMEYANQFGYSAPLAQGMLMLGKAISHIEDDLGKYLIPQQIQARFIAPVEVPVTGTDVIVHYQEKENRFELDFQHRNQRVARATITK
jgi:acyl dehydratase